MSFPRRLADSVNRVASGDLGRGKSRNVYGLSSMDSCFRRNDNLLDTEPFRDLAERLGRASPGMDDMTPIGAT